MSEIEELKSSLEANQVGLTRTELKLLINRGEWDRIGEIFNFKPEFILTGTFKRVIDWRCVPESVCSILRNKEQKFPPGDYIDPKRKKRDRGPTDGVRERIFLYNEQQGICYYCQKKIDYHKWTIDHRLPLSRGGTGDFSNKVGACHTCNHTKGSLTDTEFFTVPIALRKPFQRVWALPQLFALLARNNR